YTIDFYANTNLPHWKDQGVQYLGVVAAFTDANGNATFTATFAGTQPLKTITATALGAAEGTSEFSTPLLAVPAPPPPPPPPSPPPPPLVQPGQLSGPAGDVSALVRVLGLKLRRRADGTYRQMVLLTNTGAGALTGPLYLVLDGLTRKVK